MGRVESSGLLLPREKFCDSLSTSRRSQDSSGRKSQDLWCSSFAMLEELDFNSSCQVGRMIQVDTSQVGYGELVAVN